MFSHLRCFIYTVVVIVIVVLVYQYGDDDEEEEPLNVAVGLITRINNQFIN